MIFVILRCKITNFSRKNNFFFSQISFVAIRNIPATLHHAESIDRFRSTVFSLRVRSARVT
jgi:hypothetical protein